jgi:hypothetical protein
LTLRFTKTDAALERLDQAIDRLEKAAAAVPAALATPAAAATKSSSAMPDLFGHDELTRARQDYARLDQASRLVESRLDTMADRLQTLLEAGD